MGIEKKLAGMGGNWHETVRGREEKEMKSVEMGLICVSVQLLYTNVTLLYKHFPYSLFRWTLLGNQETESTMFYSFVV